MSTSTFSGTARPCRYCRFLVELDPAGFALCGHGGTISRQASPATGCAFWQREPGSDDDQEHDRLNDACAAALIDHLHRPQDTPDGPTDADQPAQVAEPRQA